MAHLSPIPLRADAPNPTYDEIVAQYGPWSAMAISLGDGRATRAPAVDWRLRRILQAVQDVLGDLAGKRVLDLACLEGHYAIELAAHGAKAIGTEIREANIAKARWAARELKLDVEFRRDDVRDLSRQRYGGGFDVVIASGILYHLDAPAVFDFARAIYDVTDRVAIIDTQIALHPLASVNHEGATYHGLWYREHDDRADAAVKERDLWASIDNTRSWWFTEPSLIAVLRWAGFSSVMRLESPEMPDTAPDRQTYVAIKGTRARILTSPLSDRACDAPRPEVNPVAPNPCQIPRGRTFRALKRWLPPSVKAAIKPVLRALRLLPPDTTPAFLRRK